MKSWYTINARAGGVATVTLYDEIGAFGITARDFAEELSTLGRVSQIDLHIHSPGGDVFEGLAIYNLLKNHQARIVVTVDGVAASMASVIAMAGDRVRMPENAMMMIHRPRGIAGGESSDIRRYADLMDKLEETLIPAYTAKTGKRARKSPRCWRRKRGWMVKSVLHTALLMNCWRQLRQWQNWTHNELRG